MLPAGAIGGGQNLGIAQGTIVLNTSQLAQAVQTARGLAQQLNQAMNSGATGAQRMTTGFTALTASLRSVNAELLAIGAGAGLLTKLGLEGALNLRNYTIAFRQFVGSQKEAVALTNQLIDAANKYGLEWEGAVQLGRALLPSLKEGAKDLDSWISRAARLRSLFPAAQRGSETIAILEFLAGQTISLERRFNIPKDVVDDAVAKFKDLGQALDYILERRGATEEAAVAMANAFVGVRNEVSLLLAEGFTPLFEQLQPILSMFREFVSLSREEHPGLTTAAAGLIAFTAAAVPALLLLNQMVIAAEKLRGLGVLGGLGRLGVGALAAGAGAAAGVGIVNAVGGATGNQQMQQFSLSEAWLRLRQLLVNIAFTFSEVDRIIRTGLINALRTLVNAVIGAATSIGGVVSAIGGMLPGGMGGNALQRVGADLSAGGAGLQAATNQMFDAMIANLTKRNRDALRGFMNFMVPEVGGSATPDVEGGGVARGPSRPDTAARDQAIREWATAAARIEREAGQARLDAQRQYEQQRTETIAQYNLAALREEEDYQRGRARAIAAYNQQVADLQADAVRRDTRWQADYSERLADLRADSNERLVELEEDYQRNRERAQRDHRDRLLSAAARLDAVAVREEQRRFAQQQQDAEANYSEQRQDIQAALDERIADELKAHQRRLQDAREADAERLADMRRAFAQQTAQEDEDRAIRLQRQADDHTRQLAQLDAAHAERLAQISRQAAEERAALNEGFIQQLSDLGIYQAAWRKSQQEQQDAALKQFEEFWKAFRKQFPDPPFNASGVPTADILRGSGGSATPVYTPTADVLRSGGARTITIGDVIVNAASGQSATGVAREVRRELERLLEEASQ